MNTVIFINAALNISLRKFWKCNVWWFYLFGQGVPNETKGTINLNYHQLLTKWAASWQNQQNDCAQQRLRSAWASTQTDRSSLCAQWVAKDSSFLHADSGDSGRMPRLIWVFAGRTIILLVLSRSGSFLFLWLFISTLWVQRYPYIVGWARRTQQSELPLIILCRMVHYWTTII